MRSHINRALNGLLKWNAAIINVINSTCAFPSLTGQNGCREKTVCLLHAEAKHRQDMKWCGGFLSLNWRSSPQSCKPCTSLSNIYCYCHQAVNMFLNKKLVKHCLKHLDFASWLGVNTWTQEQQKFYSSVPVYRNSVSVSQREQYQNLKPKQLNGIRPSLFLLWRQNVFGKKGLLTSTRNKIQCVRNIISVGARSPGILSSIDPPTFSWAGL